MAHSGHDARSARDGPPNPPAEGDVDAFLSPAMLWAGKERWAGLSTCTASMRRTFARVVLPFALIPPLMILYVARSRPEVYGLEALTANWEWIALLVFAAELATVWVMGRILQLTAPTDRPRPSRDQAYLLAALAAVPLWASAVVLVVPNLAALVATQMLAQAATLRVLHRGACALLRTDNEVEGLHLAYMAHSVALVVWMLLLALALLSLRTPM